MEYQLPDGLDPRPIVAELLRRGDRCAACGGGPPAGVGAFIPTDQHQAGAPPGKLRLAWYFICAQCARDPDAPGRIQAAMLSGMLAKWN